MPGHAGKFVFDAQGNARTIPYDHITITHPAIIPGVGISSFTIGTSDGTTYYFANPETITKKAVAVAASPNYFLRHYWFYKVPANTNRTSYAYAWHASSIQTAANETVYFSYNAVPAPLESPAHESRLMLRGGGTGIGTEEYRTETEVNKQYLTSITAPATQLFFNWVPAEATSYYLQSVDVKSVVGSSLIRQYFFEYANAAPRRFYGHVSEISGYGNYPPCLPQ